jgi:hypothetical protein
MRVVLNDGIVRVKIVLLLPAEAIPEIDAHNRYSSAGTITHGLAKSADLTDHHLFLKPSRI